MKRVLIICSLALLTSCKVFNPSQMLRTPANYEYAQLSDSVVDEYRIAPDDIVSFFVLPNKGERIITAISDASAARFEVNIQSYIIENDGSARLPILGTTSFGGLTRREAEAMLEKKYATHINNPYVKLSVDNRRVFVFRGGDKSSVVKLENQNTTLFEVLAQSGGTDNAKAHRIKLIRKVNQQPEIFLIDLSKAENMAQGNIVLQSNDVIYVTPRDRVPERILTGIAPYFSILATAIAVIALFK
jgi:polysaccharide biosynthesis/export protein